MGRPMDYDDYAETYAKTRSAFPWVLRALSDEVRRLRDGATVVDIGCGTGNYVIALSLEIPDRVYQGVDLSEGMLAVARSRSDAVRFARADAETALPYPEGSCDLAYVVDVLHHVADPATFFRAAARVLPANGRLIVVTDSEANIRARSLTLFFPEILEIELRRYPKIEALHEAAKAAGLVHVGTDAAEGSLPLDDDFLAKLGAKCSSAMRIIPEEAHRRGMERLRRAQAEGACWYSCYTVLKYARAMRPTRGDAVPCP